MLEAMTGEPLPDDLEAAIAGLYEAFAHRSARTHVAGCPHCIDDADHALLAARPLRQLATRDLSKYARRALTTWGDGHDLAHFLPRLLELLAREPGAWIDVEIMFGKLPLAGWRAWPAGEIAAVERYLAALWRTVLSSYPAHLDVATVLRAYSQLLDDLRPCLAAWDADDRIAALRHLAALILDNWDALWRSGSLRPTGWRGPQLAQVVAWLRRTATLARLELGFFAYSGDSFAVELSRAHDCVAGIALPTAT
jgi:hypothetical protein